MFIKDEVQYIKSNYQDIENIIKKHMNRCFDQIGEIPVGMICICFMNTSLYFHQPVFRICFYAEDIVWENPLLVHELPAEWLFNDWPYDLKTEKEMIEVRKQLRPLLIYVSGVFKYVLSRCYKFSNYERMNKAEELYICFGEYKDWQFPIYIDREEIDIFNNVDEEPLTFRRFYKKVYRNKNFDGLDLTSTVFTDCEFSNVTFSNTVLTDAIFENCSFKQIIYDECKLFGTTHEQCSLEQVDYKNTLFRLDNPTPTQMTGIYRECSFINCSQETVDYNDCDIEGVLIV